MTNRGAEVNSGTPNVSSRSNVLRAQKTSLRERLLLGIGAISMLLTGCSSVEPTQVVGEPTVEVSQQYGDSVDSLHELGQHLELELEDPDRTGDGILHLSIKADSSEIQSGGAASSMVDLGQALGIELGSVDRTGDGIKHLTLKK